MILKAIPEIHPENALVSLIGAFHYDSIYRRMIIGNPRIVLEEDFWRRLKTYINEDNGTGQIQTDLIRKQWEMQIRFVEGLEKHNLYLEGLDPSRNPVVVIAEEKGHRIISLDSEREYFSGEHRSDYEQSRREDGWVEKILKDIKNHHLKDLLMIVGGRHICGEFGLPEKLKRRGIELRVLPEFKKFYDDFPWFDSCWPLSGDGGSGSWRRDH